MYKHLAPIVDAMCAFENGDDYISESELTAGLVLAGVEPPQKALAKTGTIKAAKTSLGASAAVAIATQFSDSLQPYVPLMSKITDYAPWLVIGLLVSGIIYMVWRRIDDRLLGLR